MTSLEEIVKLEQWLKDHPDADIEAVREVRRKLTELKKNNQKTQIK